MVGGTSILARRKPDRSRQRELDGYVFMVWALGWLRIDDEKV
jgi:hypothetical protein